MREALPLQTSAADLPPHREARNGKEAPGFRIDVHRLTPASGRVSRRGGECGVEVVGWEGGGGVGGSVGVAGGWTTWLDS